MISILKNWPEKIKRNVSKVFHPVPSKGWCHLFLTIDVYLMCNIMLVSGVEYSISTFKYITE